MSTTTTLTSSCVCDDNERYERIQITLIVLACISGILALGSMIIYIKRRYNNKVLPSNNYEIAYRNNTGGNLFCCLEDSVTVIETNQRYISFIDNVNSYIDDLLLSIDLTEFNLEICFFTEPEKLLHKLTFSDKSLTSLLVKQL